MLFPSQNEPLRTMLLQTCADLQPMRTDKPPKEYYHNYTKAVEVLSRLYLHLLDCKNELSDLYNDVQMERYVVPRMYLLVVVGAASIKNGCDSLTNIVMDLHEMCRCVQHPTRGMFLRYHLITTLKSLIPDDRKLYNDKHEFSTMIRFVLENFTEMNKMWIRIKYLNYGFIKNDRKIADQKELKTLMAANMLKLEAMCNNDSKFYEEQVLRGIANDVIGSSDHGAEQFLLDCILSVFPQSFHSATVEILVEMLSKLNPGANFAESFHLIISRVQLHMEELKEAGNITELQNITSRALKSVTIFDKLGSNKVDVSTRILFYNDLLNMVVTIFPDRNDFVDELIGNIYQQISTQLVSKKLNDKLITLLNEGVLRRASDLYDCVSLPNFILLFNILTKKSALACSIIDIALEKCHKFFEGGGMELSIHIVKSILQEDFDRSDLGYAEENWARVCTFIREIRTADSFERAELLTKLKNHLFHKSQPEAVRVVLPTWFDEMLKLSHQIIDTLSSDPQKLQSTMGDIAKALFTATKLFNIPEDGQLVIHVLLRATEEMMQHTFGSVQDIANEFLNQVFVHYEEDILDHTSRTTVLKFIIAKLDKIKNLSKENKDTFFNRCTQASLNLLKKRDQCYVTIQAANLFYNPADPASMNCISGLLTRIEKLVSLCMADDVRVECSILILEAYIRFNSLECPNVTLEQISSLYQKTESLINQLSQDNKDRALLLNRFEQFNSLVKEQHSPIWETIRQS